MKINYNNIIFLILFTILNITTREQFYVAGIICPKNDSILTSHDQPKHDQPKKNYMECPNNSYAQALFASKYTIPKDTYIDFPFDEHECMSTEELGCQSPHQTVHTALTYSKIHKAEKKKLLHISNAYAYLQEMFLKSTVYRIHSLGTKESSRNHGLAFLLLNEFLSKLFLHSLHTEPSPYIFLLSTTDALKFYEKYGFLRLRENCDYFYINKDIFIESLQKKLQNKPIVIPKHKEKSFKETYFYKFLLKYHLDHYIIYTNHVSIADFSASTAFHLGAI